MTIYHPDAWVIVKISSKIAADVDSHYRVFAGWLGGFATGDSWKMNSGITRVEEDGDLVRFHGSSGSVYEVSRHVEHMTGYMMQVLTNIATVNDAAMTIEIVDYVDFRADFKEVTV